MSKLFLTQVLNELNLKVLISRKYWHLVLVPAVTSFPKVSKKHHAAQSQNPVLLIFRNFRFIKLHFTLDGWSFSSTHPSLHNSLKKKNI